MRKLYSFIASLVLSFLLMQAKAQTNEIANFNFSISGDTVQFTNTSNTPIGDTSLRRCRWIFGDGTESLTYFSTNPTHVYPHSGTFEACLRLYVRVTAYPDSLYLISSVCKTFVISSPDSCSANFQVFQSTSNGLGKYFVAQPWNNNNKKPVRVCWNFGDGHDSCINYPTSYTGAYSIFHLYSQAGNYNVCVNILYDGGCEAHYCRIVEVSSPDSCSANFQVLSSNANALTKYFIAQPWNNHNKKPVRVCWQFGDGRDTCIQYPTSYTGQYVTYHTYNQPGNYNVCVNILYDGGCEAHYCRIVEVGSPDSCSANFQVLSSSSNALGKYFIAQPWNNHNKKPVRVCWQFGDGRDTCITYSISYTGSYAVFHLYNHSGNYNVCVNILYDGGCEAHYCRIVEVGSPDSCSANFQVYQSTANRLGKYFVAQPWNSHNKKPVRVCWQFGDGRDTCIQYPTTYTGPYAVFHLYHQPGNYNVCVNILYDGGCEAHYCRLVQVGEPDSCTADFIVYQSTSNRLGKYFVAQPWNSHNKKPVRVCWQFGDGQDSCINYPTSYTGAYAIFHLYAQPGNYNVCVNILYDGGCEAHKCKIVEVTAPPDSCRADFERIPSPAASGFVAAFRALPWNSNNKKPSRICWSFGDGHDTCINYPENYTGNYEVVHTYAQRGQYEVCIHILYYGGCEASKCKTINIPGECIVQLYETTTSNNNLTRHFYAVPSSSPTQRVLMICWHFGDGSDTCIVPDNSTPPPPAFTITHTYPGPGVYHACVNVTFAGGCTAEKCIEVVIRNERDICGGYYVDSLIGQRTYGFHGQSIHNPNDQVLSYNWSFGDGTTATGQDVTHTFGSGLRFSVCLVIHTQQGCETHICKPLEVGPNVPVLQLSPNPVITNLHVVFLSGFNETVNIRIVNSSGVPVRSYTRIVVAGPNTWDFDLSTLTPGVYTFVVQSPNQFATALFLKQ